MRRIVLSGAALLVLLSVGAALLLAPQARVASAYVGKQVCSETLLAGRALSDVLENDFDNINDALKHVSVSVTLNDARAEVRTALFGLGRTRIVYREGYGCTIVKGALADPPAPSPAIPATPLPQARRGTAEAIARVDYERLEAVLDAAIADRAAAHRGLLVLVDGRIVAERYAGGFGPETPFQSWSMAKSITATLVGAAVHRGLIDIEDAPPVPEWAGDAARGAIRWDDLLRMQSGLAFEEAYGDPSSDVSRMLFDAREAGAVGADQPLIHAPGAHWAYSSGTSNIIARALRVRLEAAGADYHAFPREALFDPLGAASAVMEIDSAGNFIGSSYMYATLADWARLGELHRQDGVWNGARLLPEGWSAYVASPAPASNGEYGAHWWLNRDGEGRTRYLPGLPEDVYYMAGHEGQYVFVIPDRGAVVVRAGLTRGAVPIEVLAPVLAEIYAAISAEPAS